MLSVANKPFMLNVIILIVVILIVVAPIGVLILRTESFFTYSPFSDVQCYKTFLDNNLQLKTL
jgi:hypothetical protein